MNFYCWTFFLEDIYFPETLSIKVWVYYLGTQKLRFVTPMPEQSATTTVHFSKVSGEPSQKSSRVVWSPIGATNLIFKAHTNLRSVTMLHYSISVRVVQSRFMQSAEAKSRGPLKATDRVGCFFFVQINIWRNISLKNAVTFHAFRKQMTTKLCVNYRIDILRKSISTQSFKNGSLDWPRCNLI